MSTIDTAIRIVRYVELDAAGVPFHVAEVDVIGGGKTEGEVYREVQRLARTAGRSLVRLCNHDRCLLPDAGDLESDGRGGIRGRSERTKFDLWDDSMRRTFLKVRVEGVSSEVVVRMEPDQIKHGDLERGEFYVDGAGVFSYREFAVEAPDPGSPKGDDEATFRR